MLADTAKFDPYEPLPVNTPVVIDYWSDGFIGGKLGLSGPVRQLGYVQKHNRKGLEFFTGSGYDGTWVDPIRHVPAKQLISITPL